MGAQIKSTTDHHEIRRWVEDVGGRPVEVVVRGSSASVGVPAIEMPGETVTTGEMRAVGWDDWFDQFDSACLALLYEQTGTYSKLIQRSR
jgi:hypothetical protein